MKTKTHFRRFEFKYILPKTKADKMIPALLGHMRWDDYASQLPNNSYIVTSYYLDSANFTCYYDKIAGVDYRAKYRIRTYNDHFDINAHPEDKVFMEIKRKKSNIIIKDRSGFKWADLKDMLNSIDTAQKLNQLNKEQRSTAEEFLWSKHYNCLKPVIVVSYLRRPLVSRYDERFRVTFDYNLKTQNIDKNFNTLGLVRQVLDKDIVLELKFNNYLPQWFYRIIQGHSLRVQPYSKYCSSLERVKHTLIN